MAGFRTPLGHARGLGSAKHGVGHFIGQRVSAFALLGLTIWGAWSAVTIAPGGYDGARAWLASPINAALIVLLVVTGFYHAQLGMRVIVEDYIEDQRSERENDDSYQRGRDDAGREKVVSPKRTQRRAQPRRKPPANT